MSDAQPTAEWKEFMQEAVQEVARRKPYLTMESLQSRGRGSMPDETTPATPPNPQGQSQDTGISDWARMLRQHIGSSPGVMDLEDIRSDGSFGYKFRGQRFTVTIRRTG